MVHADWSEIDRKFSKNITYLFWYKYEVVKLFLEVRPNPNKGMPTLQGVAASNLLHLAVHLNTQTNKV